MSNEIQVFANDNFGELRTIERDAEIWFIGSEVAGILGYTNTPKAIRDHVDNEDKLTERIVLAGQHREAVIINESGLYSLVISSKLPTAKVFKRWVTSEVLPSIRKHGAYMTPEKVEEILSNPDTIIKLATQLKEEQNKRKQAEEALAIERPQAEYTRNVLSSEGYMTVTQIAKDYGRSAKWLNKVLYTEEVQYRSGNQWLLYAKYADKGYTVSGTHVVGDQSYVSTYWTQEGRKFIYDLIKERYSLTPRNEE
jgi:anti-repressor protein